mgnify:CR=1 FL=1
MPLLVRLIDSEIDAGDGVIPEALDRIQCMRGIGKQVSPGRLAVDPQVALADLHIKPVDGDAESCGDFVCAEHVWRMMPSVARNCHLDACRKPNPLNGDWQYCVCVVW